MRYRRLGTEGPSISALVLGHWLPGEQAGACVRAALDVGITTFDTADVYGEPCYGAAEEMLGRALAGVRRDQVAIFSKVGLPVGPSANQRGLARGHVLDSCTASLRRLRTDYLDLYQAHRYDPDTPLPETMLAFADLVRQGKIRAVGVSEWTAPQIEQAAAVARDMGVPLVANQPQYSLLWRAVEAEVTPVCARLGIGQLAFSPVAQGVLSGKYLPGQPRPAGSRADGTSGSVRRYLGEPLLAAVQRLRPIADATGLSLTQLSVLWVLGRPTVAGAVMGASRPEQVRHNAAVVDASPLTDGVLSAVDAALTDPLHGDLVERDPVKTGRGYEVKPSWRA